MSESLTSKHECRVVGHASGWQEKMDTCVCGKQWPCPDSPSSKPRLHVGRLFKDGSYGDEQRYVLASDYERLQRRLNDLNEYRLPCDVLLPPATVVAKGTRLQTLLAGMNMRDGLPPEQATLRRSPPPSALPAQAAVLDWAVRSFGAIAQNVDERAARVMEEAIEIAQVEGVPLEVVKRVADRVYSRPPGERWQEIGGTMIGILSYAEIIGLSVAECTQREFQRVLSKPREWWQKKHAQKVAAGTADLSPVRASETVDAQSSARSAGSDGPASCRPADETGASPGGCKKCSHPESEHHYNGACYGLCGGFVR